MFGGFELLPFDLKDELLQHITIFHKKYDDFLRIRQLLKDHYLVVAKDVNSTPIIVLDKGTYKELKKEIAKIVPDCFHFEVKSHEMERIVAQYSTIDSENREHQVRETFIIEPVLNDKYFIIKAYVLTYDGKNNFFFRTADTRVQYFLENDPQLFKIAPIELTEVPTQITSVIYVCKE